MKKSAPPTEGPDSDRIRRTAEAIDRVEQAVEAGERVTLRIAFEAGGLIRDIQNLIFHTDDRGRLSWYSPVLPGSSVKLSNHERDRHYRDNSDSSFEHPVTGGFEPRQLDSFLARVWRHHRNAVVELFIAPEWRDEVRIDEENGRAIVPIAKLRSKVRRGRQQLSKVVRHLQSLDADMVVLRLVGTNEQVLAMQVDNEWYGVPYGGEETVAGDAASRGAIAGASRALKQALKGDRPKELAKKLRGDATDDELLRFSREIRPDE